VPDGGPSVTILVVTCNQVGIGVVCITAVDSC